MIEKVSASELRTFLRCRREHAYRYGLGIEPIHEAQAFVFGKAVHAALEAWWRSSGDARLPAALAALAEGDIEGRDALSAYDSARAEQMVRAYHAQWAEQELDTISVEREFLAPLVHPITGEPSAVVGLSGRIDALAVDLRGDVWIVEHKTAQSAGPGPSWQRLRMDLQCSIYMVGARALGYEPAGVLYDVLEKPRQQPRRAPARRPGVAPETPEEYGARIAQHCKEHPPCQRGKIVFLEADEREARLDLWTVTHEIAEHRARLRAGEHAPRNPDACFRYGRFCDFLGPCTHAGDVLDEQAFRQKCGAAREPEEP